MQLVMGFLIIEKINQNYLVLNLKVVLTLVKIYVKERYINNFSLSQEKYLNCQRLSIIFLCKSCFGVVVYLSFYIVIQLVSFFSV